jgi:hypothetical protein
MEKIYPTIGTLDNPASPTAFKSFLVFCSNPDTYSSVLVVSTPFKLCSGIFLISCLNGLLLTRLIADSNSRLVLYLLRKKGDFLNGWV